MYTSNIIKSYETFMSELYIHKMILRQIIEFSEKFIYYYHYLIIRLQIEVWLIPCKQLKFLSIFSIWAKVEHMILNIIFMNFLILFELEIVQFGIIFNKHIEIHLNYKK